MATNGAKKQKMNYQARKFLWAQLSVTLLLISVSGMLSFSQAQQSAGGDNKIIKAS